MRENIPRPAGCRCHLEIGDSRCNVHPTCECCGEPVVGVVVPGHSGSDGRYCSARCANAAEGTRP